jgi:DNA-binding transcriptional LysR family regulator
MQIADLRTFLAVASMGSLSAAARHLDVAPMQVTRKIASLEEDLGVRLFHRTTRSVSLTPEGDAFLPYAQTIIEAEENARHEVSPASTSVSGVLRMTAPSAFGETIVAPLLYRLLDRYPELRIDLDLSDRVVDIVGKGLDLALRIAPLADSELIARHISSNPRVLCASPGFLSKFGRPATVADLDNFQCLGLQTVPKWPFLTDGEIRGRRVSGRFNTSSVNAVKAAAIQGLGIAMLAFWDVYQQLADGSLTRIELQDATTADLPVWAIMPTRRYIPSRVQVFLEALEADLAGKRDRHPHV